MNFLKLFNIISLILYCTNAFATEINYTNWKFNDLTSIGGIVVKPEGNPQIININNEKAIFFDGVEDRLIIENNPLIGLEEFTIEIIFRVDKGGVAEQKFIHLQANPDIRILFELEFKNDGSWYMDNFIKSGNGKSISFIDSTKSYPANRWYHAALVYKNNEFKQYINYKHENVDTLTWISPTDGSVSVGARMNKLNYMTGAVREIRFANVALESNQFLNYGELLEEHETFVLDNLVEINRHTVQVYGDPQVIDTKFGKGIEFDGTDDGIYILTNPLADAKYFTIETIIKINDVYPANAEPRYFHIEDGDDSNRRLTMELRLNNKHEWYFDGFLKASGNGSVGLMDETLTHPINGWEHCALTYDNGLFRTFVNYKQELENNWGSKLLPFGNNTKMSVGMRMNKVNHFNGIIQRIRISKNVLDPSEFMEYIPDSTSTDIDTSSTIIDTITSGITKIHNEFANQFDVHVLPNHTNGIANIKVFTSTEEFVSIELYNMEGRKIAELINNCISEGVIEYNFDFSKYQKGIYLLKIKNNKQVITKKILME